MDVASRPHKESNGGGTPEATVDPARKERERITVSPKRRVFLPSVLVVPVHRRKSILWVRRNLSLKYIYIYILVVFLHGATPEYVLIIINK